MCFKHLVTQFSWLSEIDTLLLGLWKAFHYSSLNRHIFAKLQETYGLKVLQLIKAVVTRWLSHGAACKRCRERYSQIVEALDDILTKNSNAEWFGYRSTMLKPITIFRLTFLEDVLSITNPLCLLLQSDKKDFGAIARAVDSTLSNLQEIKDDRESIFLESFKKSGDLIERVSLIEMRNTVAGATRKQSRIDPSLSRDEFHSTTIKPFIDALIKEITVAFDLSDLPILNAFLKLDPADLPENSSPEIRCFGVEELQVLHNFYGNEAKDQYHGRTTRCKKLLHCPFDALELEFGGYKSYVNTQKSKIREELLQKKKSLNSKLLLSKANKYSTKKSIKKIEYDIEDTERKLKVPITVEDLLKDEVVSLAFPNIRRLLAIYILIPQSEAVVERGFSKMSQILTKKRCALDDKSLDMLMRISHRKDPLETHELNQVIDIWKGLKDRRIFSEEI